MKAYKSFVKNHALKDYSYSSDKEKMHKAARSFLRALAKELELPDYSIRTNLGGIAVSGESTLHAERIYIQIFQSWNSGYLSILIRECNGLKDYVGGVNHYHSFHIQDYEALMTLCNHVLKRKLGVRHS